METLFAIFANVLELHDEGEPVNEQYTERRAAGWIYRYCTGTRRRANQNFQAGKPSSTDG